MFTFELKITDLILALNAVKHAAPAKGVRYYLNGIKVEVNDVHATFIATDGHRLATCKTYLASPTPVSEPFEFTINTDSIAQLLAWLKPQVFKGSARTVTIEYERKCEGGQAQPDGSKTVEHALPGELRLKSLDARAFYQARPHDEKYPDWRRVMITDQAAAQSLHSRQAFNGEYLADVAKVAKLFNAKYGGIRLSLMPGMALLTCTDADGNEFRETLMGMRD